MNKGQNEFLIELTDILKKNEHLKDVDPEEFFKFVEALIEKYFI